MRHSFISIAQSFTVFPHEFLNIQISLVSFIYIPLIELIDNFV